jgi:tetratricopeptide (TPR) repeat protein
MPAPSRNMATEDWNLLAPLLQVVEAGSEVEESHIRQAEELHARLPSVAAVRQALENLLELAARQAYGKGHPAEAVRYRVRATELWPESAGVWLRLVQYHQEREAWRDAEAAARRGVSARPDDGSLHHALAMALTQQGRDDEAADVLRRLLARRDDYAARQLLARLEKQLGSFAGLAQQRSSHFNVRFDGDADDALGKALLQTLEEKYQLLSRTLGFEPDRVIQVILYPRETFRAVSAAPEWAGGYYSRSDGRIRIGTRNMSAGFVPLDLERTLTHELAHAFLAAHTRAVTPDDVNEGLAQYLSGRRLGYRLDASRAVVRGGRIKVDDFYDSALSFVEYLIDRYRQAAMNELLETMGKTGNVDQAFRRAYHQTYAETREEWLKQLQ